MFTSFYDILIYMHAMKILGKKKILFTYVHILLFKYYTKPPPYKQMFKINSQQHKISSTVSKHIMLYVGHIEKTNIFLILCFIKKS